MEHAKRRCLAETTRFLDSVDGSNNVTIDKNVTERHRDREKKAESPTDETETDLQLLSDYNQHHSLSQRDFLPER